MIQIRLIRCMLWIGQLHFVHIPAAWNIWREQINCMWVKTNWEKQCKFCVKQRIHVCFLTSTFGGSNAKDDSFHTLKTTLCWICFLFQSQHHKPCSFRNRSVKIGTCRRSTFQPPSFCSHTILIFFHCLNLFIHIHLCRSCQSLVTYVVYQRKLGLYQ